MVQKLVLRNEVVKVKGRVKAITIKKEEFDKFLQIRKLKILDKEYEALMPPLDDLQKNTIDINGLATMVQQFISIITTNNGNTNRTTPAEMVLTTSGGNMTLSYTNGISLNSQGVTVYIQILQQNNSYTFQYYYVGFDTTNSAYSTTQLELYASAYLVDNKGSCGGGTFTFYTNTVRIAYTSASFTKTSDSYLFIVWMIEFQNIPPYLLPFTPTLQNNININLYVVCGNPNLGVVYFNSGNCNFSCGGNCPSSGLGGFITYIQNNSVILEFPVTAPLNAGVVRFVLPLLVVIILINCCTIVAKPLMSIVFFCKSSNGGIRASYSLSRILSFLICKNLSNSSFLIVIALTRPLTFTTSFLSTSF